MTRLHPFDPARDLDPQKTAYKTDPINIPSIPVNSLLDPLFDQKAKEQRKDGRYYPSTYPWCPGSGERLDTTFGLLTSDTTVMCKSCGRITKVQLVGNWREDQKLPHEKCIVIVRNHRRKNIF